MFLASSSSLASPFLALSSCSSDHGESVSQLFRADWSLWPTKALFMAVTFFLSQTIRPVRYLAKLSSWGLLKFGFIFGRNSSTMLG